MNDDISFKDLFTPLSSTKITIFIFIIGFLVFGNSLFNQFIWDDVGYILQTPFIQSFDILAILGKSMYNTGAQYRPFPAFYFTILYKIFTTNVFFYHVISLCLHCVNTVLVFHLLRKFFSDHLSFFLCLVFLVHPLQVASVVYIASAGNLLFFFFGVSALLLSREKHVSNKKLLFISFLLLLSLLSKETGILFFFLIFSYRYIFKRGKFFIFGLFLTGSLLSYLLLRICFVGRSYTQAELSPIASLSLSQRITNTPTVLSYYLKNFIFPSNIAVDQLWIVHDITFSTFYLPLLVESILIVLSFLFGVYLYKEKKKYFSTFIFLFFWLVIGLGMYSQIIPLDFTVEDRWFYFPIVGILGVFGVGLEKLSFLFHPKKILIWTSVLVTIFSFSLRTMVRNTNWYDGFTLFSHDRLYVNNYDIENNIGTEYSDRKDYTKALFHFKKSYELFPFEMNTYNMAITYQFLNKPDEAKKYYTETFQRKTFLTDKRFKEAAYIGFGEVSAMIEKPTTDSIIILEKAVQEYPYQGLIWADLAYSYYQIGENSKMEYALLKTNKYLPAKQAAVINNLIFKNVNKSK